MTLKDFYRGLVFLHAPCRSYIVEKGRKEGRKVFYYQVSVRVAQDENFSKTEVKLEIIETGVPENTSL